MCLHTYWVTCLGKSSTLFVLQLLFYVTTRDQVFTRLHASPVCNYVIITNRMHFLLRVFLMFLFLILYRIWPHILEIDEWNRIVVQMSVLPFSRPTECWCHSVRGAHAHLFHSAAVTWYAGVCRSSSDVCVVFGVSRLKRSPTLEIKRVQLKGNDVFFKTLLISTMEDLIKVA